MADTAGDIFKTNLMAVDVVYTKTNVAIIAGQCVVFDTDGFNACAAVTAAGVNAYIALDTLTAVAATRKELRILRHGYGRVLKGAAGGAL